MSIKRVVEFPNKEEVFSSDDNRVVEHLAEEFGKFHRSGGGSFSITKLSAIHLLAIMRKTKTDKIYGTSSSAEFENAKVEYLEIIANKKTYLIIGQIEEKSR